MYDGKKSLCKIAYSPVYLPLQRHYTITREYKETSDEIALVFNFDHFSIFPTKIGLWAENKETCDKHNALFYQPEDRSKFSPIHKIYDSEIFHIGMYLKNGNWKNCKGTDVKKFFWEKDEPTNNGNQNCVCINSQTKMADVVCHQSKRRGLCIF